MAMKKTGNRKRIARSLCRCPVSCRNQAGCCQPNSWHWKKNQPKMASRSRRNAIVVMVYSTEKQSQPILTLVLVSSFSRRGFVSVPLLLGSCLDLVLVRVIFFVLIPVQGYGQVLYPQTLFGARHSWTCPRLEEEEEEDDDDVYSAHLTTRSPEPKNGREPKAKTQNQSPNQSPKPKSKPRLLNARFHTENLPGVVIFRTPPGAASLFSRTVSRLAQHAAFDSRQPPLHKIATTTSLGQRRPASLLYSAW